MRRVDIFHVRQYIAEPLLKGANMENIDKALIDALNLICNFSERNLANDFSINIHDL